MSLKEITTEKGHHSPAPSTTESVKESQSVGRCNSLFIIAQNPSLVVFGLIFKIELVDYELGGSKFSHGIEREAQGSSFLAYFNVVCVVAGTGALQLPVIIIFFYTYCTTSSCEKSGKTKKNIFFHLN